MIRSNEVNKSIRKIISPILRANGFSKVNTRNNWGYHDSNIWVFNIRSVGNYFSQVTGWPPMSIGVWLGIFDTTKTKSFPKILKTDKDGLYLPQEYECHYRSHLEVTYDQSAYHDKLNNPAEKRRKDIWWIEPDGSNIDEAIYNIKESLLAHGIPWFNSQHSK